MRLSFFAASSTCSSYASIRKVSAARVRPAAGSTTAGPHVRPALLVEHGQPLAAGLLVLPQVPAAAVRALAAVGDPFELAPAVAEGKAVLDVDGPLRVVRQLLGRVLVAAQVGRSETKVEVPLLAQVDPALEPFLVRARLDEVFDLHLLEFERAKDEVAGRDLVPERLAYLGDPEGQLAAHGAGNVGEVDEHALRRFWRQIRDVLLVGDRPDLGA